MRSLSIIVVVARAVVYAGFVAWLFLIPVLLISHTQNTGAQRISASVGGAVFAAVLYSGSAVYVLRIPLAIVGCILGLLSYKLAHIRLDPAISALIGGALGLVAGISVVFATRGLANGIITLSAPALALAAGVCGAGAGALYLYIAAKATTLEHGCPAA